MGSMNKDSLKKGKKKAKTCTAAGVVHVLSTFNNNIVTVTDVQGNAISWCSSGSSGFKGSRKSTTYAAQTTASTAAKTAFDMGMRTVNVVVRGPGSGRDAAIRAVHNFFDILSIKYEVLMPFNGVRPPKKRRV